MMQTETECNDGADSWSQGMVTFGKMIEDVNHFANSYIYWNLVLGEKSRSSWGWKQNSLLTIDTRTAKIIFNPEFYALKHFGNFVRPGAVRIGISAAAPDDVADFTTSNAVAFRNPLGELIVIFRNEGDMVIPITLQSGNRTARMEIPAKSMNTFVL
jgi:glucosylceramidase